MLANLPPVLRSAFENIVLASLWFGFGKPDWEIVIAMLEKELHEVKFISMGQTVVRVKFQLVMMIADLPAKASTLRHKQFNGRHGFTLCYCPGKIIKVIIKAGKTSHSRICEADYEIRMRTRASHLQHLSNLRYQSGKTPIENFGVIGRSHLENLLANLPLTAPIDYMHQVLLGVTKSFLNLIVIKLSVTNKETIIATLKVLKAPSFLRRTPRPLCELKHYKASEFEAWLLYVGPIVFQQLHKAFYVAFLKLSSAIRCLLLNSSEIETCEVLLKEFCLFLGGLDERLQTYNLHSLRHLA